jgi:hypothetical protein
MGQRLDMREPGNPGQSEERRDRRQSSRPPFDTSELDNIPSTTNDDPPYRNWWVVTDPDHR